MRAIREVKDDVRANCYNEIFYYALDNSVCRDMIRLISLPTCVSVLFLQDRISYALQSMPNLSGKERGPHARVQKM